MGRIQRLLRRTAPWRWWGTMVALAHGVRRHPSVALIGRASQFAFGRGTVLGARVRVDVGERGTLVTGRIA
jgi:hypothetical protein